MATIGDTGYRAISDHAGDGRFTSGLIDTSFGAVIEQVGGTLWYQGRPYSVPGNLGFANILPDTDLTNGQKKQAYASVALSLHAVAAEPLTFIVTAPMTMMGAAVTTQAVPTPDANGDPQTVTLLVNGIAAMKIPVPEAVESVTFQSPPGTPLALAAGDRVALVADAALTAGAVRIDVVLWGKALHVSNNV